MSSFFVAVWMTGYTYEYDYTGSTATGIMGISTKATGGIIKGRLVIEPVDESTINIAVRFMLIIIEILLITKYY